MKTLLRNSIIYKTFIAFLFLVSLSTLLNSCKKDDEPSGSTPTVDPLQPSGDIVTTVAGTVLDEDGAPMANVQIEVHGETATTSADGAFLLENISVPGNRCVISSQRTGY